MNKQPHPYLWNCIKEFPAPKLKKLQLYTISGTCLYGFGHLVDTRQGYITHWAYCLPSPSKQAGEIK